VGILDVKILPIWVIIGAGLTAIVYGAGVPVHPPIEGVTVIVADIGVFVEFVAVKAGVFPVPFAAKPIAVFEFAHEKVAPAGLLIKLEVETVVPAHRVMFEGTVTVETGFLVTVIALEVAAAVVIHVVTLEVNH
jgi:hypothetical protein